MRLTPSITAFGIGEGERDRERCLCGFGLEDALLRLPNFPSTSGTSEQMSLCSDAVASEHSKLQKATTPQWVHWWRTSVDLQLKQQDI